MYEERLARFRQALVQQGLDGFFMRNESDIRWLTGFDGIFDGEGAFSLLITADQALLHTDSRYGAATKRAVMGTAFTLSLESKPHSTVALEALSAQGELRLGVEESLTLGEYRRLLDAIEERAREHPAMTVSVLPTEKEGVKLRAVKDPEELHRLKAAQAITDEAFSHIVTYIRPGMTERQVQRELEHYLLCHGASGLAFSSIVATGTNGASPHALPGDTPLEAGQCVTLDFGARFQGYCSDMTRVVFLGEPSETMRCAYAALRQANETVQAILKPGITGAEAHDCAEHILAEAGFGGTMGHGLGHGVGLDIHEEPTLSPRNKEPLQVGNVITVEPGIYLEDKFGMRLEDFGVVTESGFDVFSQSTHEIVII